MTSIAGHLPGSLTPESLKSLIRLYFFVNSAFCVLRIYVYYDVIFLSHTIMWRFNTMRIMKGKSKDPTYHVIQDVKRNGKRSTEIIENLGNASEICKKYNVTDADAWANEYVNQLRENEKSKNHKILIPFNKDKSIPKDEILSFNVGYLILQKIYHKLGLPTICRNIKKENSFDYDLDSILSRLVYGRILFPSSKTFVLQEIPKAS